MLDASLKKLFRGKRSDFLWIGTLTRPEKIILLFRTLLISTKPTYHPPPQPNFIPLVESDRACLISALFLPRFFSPLDQKCITACKPLINNTKTLELQYIVHIMTWPTVLESINASSLPNIISNFATAIQNCENGNEISSSSSGIPTSVRITAERGCTLNETQKAEVAALIISSEHPKNIPLTNMKFLSLLVGTVISYYSPGANDISFISSAQPLVNIIQQT